jgi:predicted metallo-beta-lactamase superfamily hydrolase
MKVKEEYQVKISSRFAALDDEAIIRASESIRENMKASATEILCYYELKLHKPWFDKEYSKLLDQRKQAKLQ